MSRRRFLRQLAAAAAAAAAATAGGCTAGQASRARHAAPLHVGVIGAGIVGAAIACHLAQAGARVTVFEKATPASGATQNSFAWLNAFVSNPEYRALRLQSLAAYRELDKPLGLRIRWGGYASWAGSAAQLKGLRESAAQMADTGYPVRSIDAAALTALAPGLLPGPVAEAFFSGIDAHLDPVAATRQFLGAARRGGATVMLQCSVQGLDLREGRLAVVTSQGRVALDRLVVAAGVDTPGILAMAGFDLRLRHAPGILAHSKPAAPVTATIFDAPGGLSFKQMTDGSIVGTDSPEPPDIPVHHEIREHAMDFAEQGLRDMHGQRILGKIAAILPAARGLPLERLTLGFRPLPLDDLPVVGALPGAARVHVVVTHSGVTLAPILGRLVTGEVLNDSRSAALAPFRPERFAT
jgi:glycine/D-amino acid oxidase-like deaminating enzyme